MAALQQIGAMVDLLQAEAYCKAEFKTDVPVYAAVRMVPPPRPSLCGLDGFFYANTVGETVDNPTMASGGRHAMATENELDMPNTLLVICARGILSMHIGHDYELILDGVAVDSISMHKKPEKLVGVKVVKGKSVTLSYANTKTEYSSATTVRTYPLNNPEYPEKLGKLLGFLQEHGWEKHEVVRKADRLSTLPQRLQDGAAGKGMNGWTATGWAKPEGTEVDPAQGGAPKSQQITVVQGTAVGSKV